MLIRGVALVSVLNLRIATRGKIMKRILLTTTALTMTAGIAAAEVSITGDFRLGFNDLVSDGTAQVGTPGLPAGVNPPTAATAASWDYAAAVVHDKKAGIYNDAGITIAMSSALDNGMAAGITVDLDGNDFGAQAQDKYTFSLSNDSTNVSFGSTEYSAITNWTSAGDMATDTWANQNADDKNVLRAETTVGGLKVSVSQNIAANNVSATSDPVSLTVGGSLGGATYVLANEGSKMGIAVSNALGGATITTAYSTATVRTKAIAATAVAFPGVAEADDTAGTLDTSTGVKIAYPMGAIVATASYVMESNGVCTAGTNLCVAAGDAWNVAAVWTSGDTSVTFKTDEASANSVEGSTKLGAASLAAGLTDSLEDMYISVTNPLGGGASIMASYAIDGDGSADAKDEIGGPDLQEGLTVELKFAF
jgi:outer membrane protein OmpU